MKRKHLILIAGGIIMIIVTGAYATWNRLDPGYTCAGCHEVAPSHARWLESAHAGIMCTECHGTAISNGFHSLKEKAGMVFTHLTGSKHPDDIRLTEEQVLEISDRCASCHQSEYAGWLSGGHAVSYCEIFMDSAHNAMEKPYWDCFRCHGMFYEGNIHDLMDLESEQPSGWAIRDKKQEMRPSVPCLACHQMHTENPVSVRYVSMTGSTRFQVTRNPKTALYVRADKMYLRSDYLSHPVMTDGEHPVQVSNDPNNLLCMQCHSPDYAHKAGTEDDRTPVGVHEGISCITCHKPHSGETRQSCSQCHPAMSNCGTDVEKMETTFLNPASPNDIHRITCTSCHENKKI